MHGVSLIDRQGHCSTTYRNSESTKLFDYPRQIAVTKNGLVLVVDCGSNRLVLLDASLRLGRALTLPIESRLNRPACFYFNESLGQLYVGEAAGMRVITYDNISFE